MEIARPLYLERLIKRRNNGMVKVVTGIRRCGKSYLLFTIFKNHLIASGFSADHIIEIDLDNVENEHLYDRTALYTHIKDRLADSQPYVVLIDEIQHVKGFEGVINGLMKVAGIDIYITGSNSKFLSSDIITEFRGRGDQVRIRPLSFSEFYPAHGGTKEEAWNDYYTYGGLPLVLLQDDESSKIDYLNDLFETVYVRDICDRYSLHNDEALGIVVDILASTAGSLTNPSKIEKTFKSERQKTITDKTISAYIQHLDDAFLLESAQRYDVRGRKHIGTPKKYYFTDVGLRNARLSFREQDENHIMETVIYNELRMRGYAVDVGVVDVLETSGNGKRIRKHLEIDFIAKRGNDQCYIQSAFEMPTGEKERQEYRPLRSVNDSFRKYVITRPDIKAKRDNDGIVTMGLLDFLVDQDSLSR